MHLYNIMISGLNWKLRAYCNSLPCNFDVQIMAMPHGDTNSKINASNDDICSNYLLFLLDSKYKKKTKQNSPEKKYCCIVFEN